MSLFNGTLAFGDSTELQFAKIGVLVASVLAGIVGTAILMSAAPVADEA